MNIVDYVRCTECGVDGPAGIMPSDSLGYYVDGKIDSFTCDTCVSEDSFSDLVVLAKLSGRKNVGDIEVRWLGGDD